MAMKGSKALLGVIVVVTFSSVYRWENTKPCIANVLKLNTIYRGTFYGSFKLSIRKQDHDGETYR